MDLDGQAPCARDAPIAKRGMQGGARRQALGRRRDFQKPSAFILVLSVPFLAHQPALLQLRMLLLCPVPFLRLGALVL